MTPEFVEFPAIPRLSRPCIITEKIDGTNGVVAVLEDGVVLAGSRSRWITPEQDNHGFAKWVKEHADDLRDGLGVGTHFGEWWGQGVNKRYPMIAPKRFSLFNVHRWREKRPACCDVVPVLYEGMFLTSAVEDALGQLAAHGSVAAPGCTKPEGVVVFHVQSRLSFKKTLERDEAPKSLHPERSEAHERVAPAGSGSRESRTTAGAAMGHEGAPTGGDSREEKGTR